MDTEAGLIVPVLREVDKKNLLELSKELEELAKKARERKLSAEEMKGGTFTCSRIVSQRRIPSSTGVGPYMMEPAITDKSPISLGSPAR